MLEALLHNHSAPLSETILSVRHVSFKCLCFKQYDLLKATLQEVAASFKVGQGMDICFTAFLAVMCTSWHIEGMKTTCV